MWLLNQVPLRMTRLDWFYKIDKKSISGDMQIRVRRRAVLILAAVCALLAAGIPAQEIRDGETLLRAMHGRYQNNWYETLTFTQKSTTHNDDGTDKSEIWHEAMLLPGNLRIDIGPPADGNGMLVANGALTSFQNGKASDPHPFVHMLLVLGFDVYRQPTQATVDQVKGRSEEHTSELQSRFDLVCRLLLEKKKVRGRGGRVPRAGLGAPPTRPPSARSRAAPLPRPERSRAPDHPLPGRLCADGGLRGPPAP